VGTVNTTSNTLTITTVSVANQFSWWVLVDQGSPLPVELLYFEAKPENSNVRLRWTTATELNNDYFTVQSSADGITFNDIAKIQGAGTSQTLNKYSYLDMEANPGRTYYRLKQTDFDGKFKFSDVVKVDLENTSTPSFSVYPNPTSDKFTLSSNTAVESISLLSSQGDLISAVSDQMLEGEFFKEFDLSENIAGLYIVKIVHNKGTNFIKVIKR
jgi:hypothetical protein